MRYSQQLSHKYELKTKKQEQRSLYEALFIVFVAVVLVAVLAGFIYG